LERRLIRLGLSFSISKTSSYLMNYLMICRTYARTIVLARISAVL